MAKEKIELVLIFQRANSGPLDHIRYFSQLVKELFGSAFEEISYSLLLKGRRYNKLKSKTMKFSDKAIESFESDLPNLRNGGFELLTLLPGWEYKSIDIKFSVLYDADFNRRGDRIMTFSLDMESFLALYPQDKIIELYLGMARYIQGKEGELVYGFIFSMAGEKFPGMFIAGIGNDKLSDKEEELLKAWNEGKDQCDKQVWTVLWGNLVTGRHFKRPESLDKLKKVVGNVDELGGSAFFFHLPGDSLELGMENERIRREILPLFRE